MMISDQLEALHVVVVVTLRVYPVVGPNVLFCDAISLVVAKTFFSFAEIDLSFLEKKEKQISWGFSFLIFSFFSFYNNSKRFGKF